MKTIFEKKMFGGTQIVYEHYSDVCECSMKFAVYKPRITKNLSSLFWLSGLTCSEENFISKAGAQRLADKLGILIITPDTSPRGESIPDITDQYDFGKGAGFYLDATEDPWKRNYKMESYITTELMSLIEQNIPQFNKSKVGISGHSMGGHGALTLHLKNPNIFKTCSAFSPIVTPSLVPWGQKAFNGYLADKKEWGNYDATILVEKFPSSAHILIDQGLSDEFLNNQLEPLIFKKACEKSKQKLTLRMQEGYDHSYYFIASFIDDHLNWHHNEIQI